MTSAMKPSKAPRQAVACCRTVAHSFSASTARSIASIWPRIRFKRFNNFTFSFATWLMAAHLAQLYQGRVLFAYFALWPRVYRPDGLPTWSPDRDEAGVAAFC